MQTNSNTYPASSPLVYEITSRMLNAEQITKQIYLKILIIKFNKKNLYYSVTNYYKYFRWKNEYFPIPLYQALLKKINTLDLKWIQLSSPPKSLIKLEYIEIYTSKFKEEGGSFQPSELWLIHFDFFALNAIFALFNI